MEERDIICAAPIIEEVEEYMSEGADPILLSVDTSSEMLEDEMLRTYIAIMRDNDSKDRRAAASDVAEILGKKGKKSITVVNAENAQINNQNVLPEEMRKHLMSANQGLKGLTDATNAGIKIKEGGSGA